VIGPLRLSFGNARMRARKSRLRDAWDLRRLRAGGVDRVDEAAETPPLRETSRLESALFGRLLEDYGRILEDYPSGRPLVAALLARHEVENLKLGWRALSRRLPPARWTRLWRPFGRLETIPIASWSEASSLAAAVRSTDRTPFGSLARETFEAHADDVPAAELSLDRAAFGRIAEEAERLPRRETVARRLTLSLVFERDLDAFRRSVAFSGLSPELAGAATIRLARSLPPEALSRLADWTSGPLPVDGRLFRGIVPADRAISGWDALAMAIRRARVADCRRAFLGPPFRIGPAVAFLLLKEAEARALTALRSLLPGAEAPRHGAVERALAASLLGG
jgi:vacuolar-type H+-ATPase subunit C/Vma6